MPSSASQVPEACSELGQSPSLKSSSSSIMPEFVIGRVTRHIAAFVLDVSLSISLLLRGLFDSSVVLPHVLTLKSVWRVLRRLTESALSPKRLFKELRYDVLYHTFDWLPQILAFLMLIVALPSAARVLVEIATYIVTWDIGFANERAILLFLLMRLVFIRPFDRCFLWGLRYINPSYAYDLASLPRPPSHVIFRASILRIIAVRIALAIIWFIAEFLADASQVSFVTSSFTYMCNDFSASSCTSLESRCVPLLDTFFVPECWAAYPTFRRSLYLASAGSLGTPFSGLMSTAQFDHLNASAEFPSRVGRAVGAFIYVLQHIIVAAAIARELFDPLFARVSFYLGNRSKRLHEHRERSSQLATNTQSASNPGTITDSAPRGLNPRSLHHIHDPNPIAESSGKTISRPAILKRLGWALGRLQRSLCDVLYLGPATFPSYATAFDLNSALAQADADAKPFPLTSGSNADTEAYFMIRPWNPEYPQEWDIGEYLSSTDDIGHLCETLASHPPVSVSPSMLSPQVQPAPRSRRASGIARHFTFEAAPPTSSVVSNMTTNRLSSFSFHENSVRPDLVSLQPSVVEFDVAVTTPHSARSGSKPVVRTSTDSITTSVAQPTLSVSSSSTGLAQPTVSQVDIPPHAAAMACGISSTKVSPDGSSLTFLFADLSHESLEVVSVGSDGSAKTEQHSLGGGSDLSSMPFSIESTSGAGITASHLSMPMNGMCGTPRRKPPSVKVDHDRRRRRHQNHLDVFEIEEVELAESAEQAAADESPENHSDREDEEAFDPRNVDPIAYASSLAAAAAAQDDESDHPEPSPYSPTGLILRAQIAIPRPHSSYVTSFQTAPATSPPTLPTPRSDHHDPDMLGLATNTGDMKAEVNPHPIIPLLDIFVHFLKYSKAQFVAHWRSDSILIQEQPASTNTPPLAEVVPSIRLGLVSSSLALRAYLLGVGLTFLLIITSLPLCLGGVLALHLAAAAGSVLGGDLTRPTMLARVNVIKTLDMNQQHESPMAPTTSSIGGNLVRLQDHPSLQSVAKYMTAVVYTAPLPLSRVSASSRYPILASVISFFKLSKELFKAFTDLEFVLGWNIARPILCSPLWLRQASRNTDLRQKLPS